MSDTNESQVVIALRSFVAEYAWDTNLFPVTEMSEKCFKRPLLTSEQLEESSDYLDRFINGKF